MDAVPSDVRCVRFYACEPSAMFMEARFEGADGSVSMSHLLLDRDGSLENAFASHVAEEDPDEEDLDMPFVSLTLEQGVGLLEHFGILPTEENLEGTKRAAFGHIVRAVRSEPVPSIEPAAKVSAKEAGELFARPDYALWFFPPVGLASADVPPPRHGKDLEAWRRKALSRLAKTSEPESLRRVCEWMSLYHLYGDDEGAARRILRLGIDAERNFEKAHLPRLMIDRLFVQGSESPAGAFDNEEAYESFVARVVDRAIERGDSPEITSLYNEFLRLGFSDEEARDEMITVLAEASRGQVD